MFIILYIYVNLAFFMPFVYNNGIKGIWLKGHLNSHNESLISLTFYHLIPTWVNAGLNPPDCKNMRINEHLTLCHSISVAGPLT